MIKRWVQIIFIIAFVFGLNGCRESSSTKNDVTDIIQTPERSLIHKQLPKTPDSAISIVTDYTAYQNTTILNVQIGDYLDENIYNISSVNKPINLAEKETLHVEQITIRKYTQAKTSWYVNITFDNDIFSNTDYYYTHGITINLAIPNLKKSPVNNIFFAPKNNDLEFCGFSLTQNIYTPTNPDTKRILHGDRPFSAYLTLGQFREVYNLKKNLYVKSQLNLGVLGPSSLGGQVQSSIHEIEPVGWQNQINNSFIIDYNFQIKRAIYSSSNLDFNIKGNANIGTLYNKLGGGFDLRFGKFMPFYSGPVSVFKDIDETGSLQYWFFMGSSLKIVGYNASLQGGMFNNNNPYTIPASDVNRLVFSASAGFALYYNKLGFEYEHFYLTPEFKGARHFGWGRIKAVLAF